MTKRNWIYGLTVAAIALTAGFSYSARAEETAGEKVQNAGDEAWKDTKKGGRKLKKKTRDATGNSSAKEDMKDSAKNVGDSVETGANKVERKVD
jgi:hypothetical protein